MFQDNVNKLLFPISRNCHEFNKGTLISFCEDIAIFYVKGISQMRFMKKTTLW